MMGKTSKFSYSSSTSPYFFFFFTITILIFVSGSLIEATTDPADVGALQVFYTSLNSPSQLSGWKSDSGDPCGESWKGIICEGSSVVAIQVSGMGLTGTLGYLLSDLFNLKTLDLSDNTIHDSIPYQLPPNLTTLNLAKNNLTGNLPYSISLMTSLIYLNVSQNSLSQPIGDILANLQAVSLMDLSFNNFVGDLPNSFSSMSNLSSLYLQNNELTGSINVLAGLPLTNLNIANNHFTGWIPWEFKSIPNLISDGNSFDNGPAPPPPPYTSPPPGISHDKHNRTRGDGSDSQGSHSGQEKKLKVGPIIGIVVGSIVVLSCAMLALVFCFRRFSKDKQEDERSSRDFLGALSLGKDKEVQDPRVKSTATTTDLKPLPAEILMGERGYGKPGSVKRTSSPITATSYTIASLQTATNSFSQECLVGEGSLGRVYRAEFPNEKILAVKKIDSAALSLQEDDHFVEAVSNMSRLRHPNIVTLVGYSTEHGQRILVYECIGNGNLHDMLHFGDDSGKSLPWNARVKVALGTARALEYLHEVCLPSVVHRNFKSANILLDEQFNPHLSDCGLAALTPNTERQVSTQMVASFGYSAPEFAMSGIYTVKSDVYSFGVVMLELLTGRKPLDSSRPRAEQSLVRWATPQLHDIDALSRMVDPALDGMYPAKSLSRFADIIALCVQPEPEFRPPVSEVVQALIRLMQRASVVKRRSNEESAFPYKLSDYEAIEMSF